jgi:hypothetical protein
MIGQLRVCPARAPRSRSAVPHFWRSACMKLGFEQEIAEIAEGRRRRIGLQQIALLFSAPSCSFWPSSRGRHRDSSLIPPTEPGRTSSSTRTRRDRLSSMPSNVGAGSVRWVVRRKCPSGLAAKKRKRHKRNDDWPIPVDERYRSLEFCAFCAFSRPSGFAEPGGCTEPRRATAVPGRTLLQRGR